MSDFFENFYGVLFTPDKTLSRLKEESPIMQASCIVVFVSMLNFLLNFSLSNRLSDFVLLGVGLLGAVLTGFLSWVFFAAFLELIAGIFQQGGKIKQFLVLSAFALIPWIFIAPINLLKTGGFIGIFFAILLGLFVWLWVSILYFVSILKVYELNLGRGLLLIALPFLAGIINFHWLVGFWTTLFQLLRV